MEAIFLLGPKVFYEKTFLDNAWPSAGDGFRTFVPSVAGGLAG